ncbi:hypothetical protein HNV12_03445 [Methanococcoides sp. SA1]|nr:hypothetical protein [Methanococcoides sp. SA1]
MDEVEAKKVLKIISEADHGCPYCVEELLNLFILEFPKHKGIVDNYIKKNSEKFYKVKDFREIDNEK